MELYMQGLLIEAPADTPQKILTQLYSRSPWGVQTPQVLEQTAEKQALGLQDKAVSIASLIERDK